MFLALSIFSSSLVLASADTAQMNLKFINPVNGTTISGRTAFILNVTNATSYGQHDETNLTLYNCTFSFRSVSTANSSWTVVKTDAGVETSNNGTIGNLTDGWFVTQTVNLTQLEDANNYQFNSTCRTINATISAQVSNISSMASTANIIIDYDLPGAPSSLSPASASTDVDGILNFTSTVIGANTTGCNLSLKTSGGSSYTQYLMTHSANSCWLNFNNLDSETYTWFVSAQDGTNSTNSSALQVNVDKDEGTAIYITDEKGNVLGAGALAVGGGIKEKIANIPIMGWITILVIIIFVIWFFSGKTFYPKNN